MSAVVRSDLIQGCWTILRETRSGKSGVYVLARCSCGTEREVLRHRIASGRSRSCGCQKGEPSARFWKFVPAADPEQCWEWQSVRNKSGYGKFWFHGRTDLAHRVSYRLNNGPIEPGQIVRHMCDNPPCVNPSHLLLGTGKDNARDAIERGRYRRGVDNGNAKLTTQQVSEVRRRWASGETQVSIGRSFGVSKSTVQWILNGRTWAGVGEAS